MTASKPPVRSKQSYLQHGMISLERALSRVAVDAEGVDWTEALGPVGVALRAWRSDLIDALGGDDVVSPQQRALIELATRTHLMVESVDRFILGMPSLINKSKRSIFAVVKERQQLADALARYLGQLGLERRAKPTLGLSDYLATRRSPREPTNAGGPSHGASEPSNVVQRGSAEASREAGEAS